MESYNWDHDLDGSFKAKCSTDSRVEESEEEGGSQMGEPYSKTGHTMVRVGCLWKSLCKNVDKLNQDT